VDTASLTATVEADGNVAGSGRVEWWDEADGTRLYLLLGEIESRWRRRGLGRTLLARLEEQAAAHWRAHPTGGPPLLGMNPDDEATLALAHEAGYRVRFTLVDLARDPAGAADVPLPPGVTLRPVRDDQHPQIYAAIDTCFADSRLGQEIRDYAEYLDNVRDTDLWLVAWAGTEVAGLVVNEREPDGSVDSSWVAVLPPWRRRGLASALLQHSLRLMAAHGVRTATIRTVRENPHRTVALYERAGYRVTALTTRYAKPLPLG
jgi:ribosomal protein S18 acetylase RimI-like enzyme